MGSNKNVMNAVVVGYSISGKSACELLKANNWNVKVYEDDYDIKTWPYKNIKGKDLFEELSDVDLVVVSPSISFDSKIVSYANKYGIEVISEIELAYRYANHDIVAVTGTNGKTTTTLMIKSILSNSGIDAHEVGNIGKPYSSELKDMTESSVAVLEVSSFQLEGVSKFKAKYAICLNISEDHLQRHKTMSIYSLCKQRVFINQEKEDVAILNYDDQIVRNFSKTINSNIYYFSTKQKVKGTYVLDGYIVCEINNFEKIMPVKDLNIKGEHNLSNALAAITLAKLLNIDNCIIKSTLSYFKAPAFRIEYIGKIKGKDIYNDSKATNIDSTIKACKSIKDSITLIVGGYDKGIAYDSFYNQLPENVKHIVFYGDNTYTMLSFMPQDVPYDYKIATSMKRAVAMAFESDSNVILFSPSSSSFDKYASYLERGEDFSSTIRDYYSC